MREEQNPQTGNNGALDARNQRERGFTLVTTGIALFGIMGMTALAIDVGRMYIAKNEVQVYTDAAALEAVLELDGNTAGFQRARDKVAASGNRWNFGGSAFTGTQVEFAQNSAGPWQANPATGPEYSFVRVTANVSVPMTFIRTLASGATRPVASRAVAGQVLKTGSSEGVFPFSPFAHDNVGPNFGLIPGQLYTLRWASNPKLTGSNTCPGDRTQAMIDLAQMGGGEERGFIEESSSSNIRQAIVYDYQTVYRQIGDSVNMTGGAKQTQLDSIIARVNQDSDSQSATYGEYQQRSSGNGRRLIVAPVNSGFTGGNVILQFGLFFLLPPNAYKAGGNQPFCAEYVGAFLQGSSRKGASNTPGFYVARLVE